MTKRILHVVTNVSHYAGPAEPTGLWLSELTHAYDISEARGYEQQIVSPKGGKSPLVWLPGKIPSRPNHGQEDRRHVGMTSRKATDEMKTKLISAERLRSRPQPPPRASLACGDPTRPNGWRA